MKSFSNCASSSCRFTSLWMVSLPTPFIRRNPSIPSFLGFSFLSCSLCCLVRPPLFDHLLKGKASIVPGILLHEPYFILFLFFGHMMDRLLAIHEILYLKKEYMKFKQKLTCFWTSKYKPIGTKTLKQYGLSENSGNLEMHL
jgi:hypothetical protein